MEDETVTYKRRDIINILRDLEMIVVSLDRIGSAEAELLEMGKPEHEVNSILSDWFDDWDVFRKLALARRILDEAFSRELGDDDMDELEREFQDLQYWSRPNVNRDNVNEANK